MFEAEYLLAVVVVVPYGYLLLYNGSHGGRYHGAEAAGARSALAGGDCNTLLPDHEVFKQVPMAFCICPTLFRS